MKPLKYWPVVQYRILWFLSTRCALFWPRQKNIWGQLPLDVSTGSAVQVLSEPMGKQKVPRVRWCWPNNQRFRIDSTIVLRFFPILPDKLKLLYRWTVIQMELQRNPTISNPSKRYPRQIQSWHRIAVDNFAFWFSRSSTTERPRECVFLAQLAPQWETTGSRQGVIEMLRNRCFFLLGSNGVIPNKSQNFQWFCSLGFECWYYICWY